MTRELKQAEDHSVSPSLSNLYQGLTVNEQEYFKQKDFQLWQTSQSAFINFGRIALEVREHIARPGAHSGITFEKWMKAHGFAKKTTYRAMDVADGYNRLLGSNNPDKENMINSYLALPKKYQELIANGKANDEKTNLILHADEEFRNTPHFKALLKSLDEQKATTEKVQKANEDLEAENHRLTKHNADVEKSRSETLMELEKEREKSRHLQMLNEHLKNQERAEVEVPPADYDELKQNVMELRSQLKDSDEDLKLAEQRLRQAQENSYSKEDIDDLQGTIDQLNKENRELQNKLKVATDATEQKRLAFERVSEKTSEMLTSASKIDVLALTPDIKKLTPGELEQTDLANLGQWFLDRATQIQGLCKGETTDEKDNQVIDGEFSNV